MDACVAPNCNNKRHNESMHCRVHARDFSALYAKYKKTQTPINKYIDNPQSVTKLNNAELLRIISISNNVALLRKKYQDVAFKKEFHDEGHTKFIEKLLELSNVITDVLEERFQPYLQSSSEEESDYSDVSVEETVAVDTKTKKIVDDFLIAREDLIREMDEIISIKEQFFDNIRQRIGVIRDLVNISLEASDAFVEGSEISLEDKLVGLLCSLDWIERAYYEGLEHDIEERKALDKLLESGTVYPEEFKYRDREGKINHLLLRKDRVFNWDTMYSLDEYIELIYQGIIPLPMLRENCDVYDAVAALINAARSHPYMFMWHFVVDTSNDNNISVYINKVTPKIAGCSAKKLNRGKCRA